MYQSVIADLRKVDQDFTNESRFFDSSKFSDREKGKRLLFLFQCDLLPGISGKILEAKGARDFEKPTFVLARSKLAAWVFVILLNLGMWFYIFLFALNQTKHRQAAWFNSFVLWLVVEVLLISTVMALVTHVVIPSVIMKDVTMIKKKLLENFRDYYQRSRDGSSSRAEERTEGAEEQKDKQSTFNAARYLFVSSRLAMAHPELREAKVIAHFSTPWPKQSYQHINEISKGYGRRFSAITKSISIILVFLLTSLLNIPSTFQDMVIHLAATSAMGYTILLHIQLFDIFPVLAFGPILALCAIVHFVVQSGKASAKQRLARLVPITSGTHGGDRGRDMSVVKRTTSIDCPPPKVIEYIEGEDVSGVVGMSSSVTVDEEAVAATAVPLHLAFPSAVGSSHTTRRASTVQGVNVLRQLYQIGEEEEEGAAEMLRLAAERGSSRAKGSATGESEKEDERKDDSDDVFPSVPMGGFYSNGEYDEDEQLQEEEEVRGGEVTFCLDLEIEKSMKKMLAMNNDTFVAAAASRKNYSNRGDGVGSPRSYPSYLNSSRDDDSISYFEPE